MTPANKELPQDQRFMRVALGLARRGLGRTAPNPSVGCVIVKDGHIAGRGWTAPGGRPHAETEALARAGDLARGATAYVTLEPCAHTGETPPCAQALIDAGISRVVSALRDPDPRVDGGGHAMLQDAGIQVTTDILSAEAEELNAGFLLRIREGRPLVTLKLATSLDSKIATRTGESKWITGEAARQAGHMLRATHDAILVGSGTAIADDPELTCRIAGLEDCSPLRVLLDGRLRVPLTHKLVTSAKDTPTHYFILPVQGPAQEERRGALEEAGVVVHEIAADANGNIEIAAVLTELSELGVNRLLLEGGGTVAASFLAADVIDIVKWFRAPVIVGGDGIAAIGPVGLENLADAQRFESGSVRMRGNDICETYRRRR